MPWCLLGILIAEINSHVFSVYRANSFYSLEKITYWVAYCWGLRWTLKKMKASNAMHLVFYLMTAITLIFSLGGSLSFEFFKSGLYALGWKEIYPFKGSFSPFGFKLNDWSTFCIILLPFPLIAAMLGRKNTFLFTLCSVLFILTTYAVLISFSRGAYISIIFFFISLVGLTIHFRLLEDKKWLKPMVISMILLILLSYPISTGIYTTLSMTKTESQQRSTTGRKEILKNGLKKVNVHPLEGRGGYNFGIGESSNASQREDAGTSLYSNNLYLQLLVEKGWIGLFMYCALFFYTLWSLFAACRDSKNKQDQFICVVLLSGLIAYCIKEIFFASFFENNMILMLIGFYCAYSSASCAPSYKKEQRRRYIPFLAVLLATIVWVEALKLKNNKSDRLIQTAMNQGKTSRSNALNTIEKALKITPEIAPYHALAGLALVQDSLRIKGLFSHKVGADSVTIQQSILHYKRALKISPDQASLHFNLASLYYNLEGSDPSQSEFHFKKSIDLEPNNSEFLIGYGLCQERSLRINAAWDLYERAIRIDPEIINSDFYKDFISRNIQAVKWIEQIADSMRSTLHKSFNPIVAARLATLNMATGDTLAAQKLLLKAIDKIPNLSRPYYYLGKIAMHQGDSIKALKLYRKSLYLNPKDYLPVLELGDYYFSKKTILPGTKASISYYYTEGLDLYRHQPSQSSNKDAGLYRHHYYPPNDLVWGDLVLYIRTSLHEDEIRSKIDQMNR